MNPAIQDTWNKLVTDDDSSKIYHLYQWGTLLDEVYRYRLLYLQEDNGIFPLAYIQSRIFGNRLISLPFADYGGPCAKDNGTANKLIAQCQEVARDLDVDFIEIRCPDKRYSATLNERGFVRRDDYLTFILPLDRKIEELWKGIGDKNRNMVRKAERNGVQVVEAGSKADLQKFYLLYQKTMKKLGSPPQPFRFFEKLWGFFYPQSLIIPLAKYDEKYIAGGLFFLHQGTIHHAYSCSSGKYLQLAPNDLIQWYTIRWGNEHGFSYLDSGRSRENEGTVLFKKRWGGIPVKMPYFYQFCKKKLKERQEIRYQRISDLWSRYMPESIANRLGPWVIKQIG